MTLTFRERLIASQQKTQSTLAVGIAPILARFPLEISKFDDPFYPFSRAIIDITADLACAYVFHLGMFLAHGAAGAVALERSLAYVPDSAIKILHGPFASPDYVQAAFEDAFNAHAVTLSTHVSLKTIAAYAADSSHGLFIKAPTDSDFDRIGSASAKYPDQVGLYRFSNPTGVLELWSEARIELEWHVDDIVYAAATDDWRNAVREAADQRRSAPQKNAWSS
jgi:hypothetical protein